MIEILANTDLSPILAISWGGILHYIWWIALVALLIGCWVVGSENEGGGILLAVVVLVVMNMCYQPSEETIAEEARKAQEAAALAAEEAQEAAALAAEEEAEREKEQAEKKEVEDEFNAFKSGDGRDIHKAVVDLEVLESLLLERLNELELFIKKLDREPDEDEDYRQWKTHLEDVQRDKNKLDESLKDAFLEYKKFKLTSTGSEMESFKKSMEAGSAEAESVIEQYERLKKKLQDGGGDKNEDNPLLPDGSSEDK